MSCNVKICYTLMVPFLLLLLYHLHTFDDFDVVAKGWQVVGTIINSHKTNQV